MHGFVRWNDWHRWMMTNWLRDLFFWRCFVKIIAMTTRFGGKMNISLDGDLCRTMNSYVIHNSGSSVTPLFQLFFFFGQIIHFVVSPFGFSQEFCTPLPSMAHSLNHYSIIRYLIGWTFGFCDRQYCGHRFIAQIAIHLFFLLLSDDFRWLRTFHGLFHRIANYRAELSDTLQKRYEEKHTDSMNAIIFNFSKTIKTILTIADWWVVLSLSLSIFCNHNFPAKQRRWSHWPAWLWL